MDLGVAIETLGTITLLTTCTTTRGTALGFIGEAFLCEKLLLRCTEYELVATVSTSEGLVFETHGVTSSLDGLVRVTVIPGLVECLYVAVLSKTENGLNYNYLAQCTTFLRQVQI